MSIRILATVVAGLLLAVTSVIVIFVVIAVRHAWTQRRAPLIEAARAALSSVAASGTPSQNATDLLLRLRQAERIAVFSVLGPSISGDSLTAVRTVAADLGLITWAHRSLDSRSWARRLVAARFLVAMGAGCHDLAPTMFSDPHPAVRVQAATWAASCGALAPIDLVVGMLSDPDGRCRFAAKDALIRIGLDALPTLHRLLDSADSLTITAALEVASAIGDPSLSTQAERIAVAGTPRQRALAAAVLGASGSQVTGPALRALLNDPEPEVREAATIALAEQGDWSAAVPIAALLGDSVWGVRREAGLALLRLGAPGIVLLREAALGAGEARSIAIQALELRKLNIGV